MKKLPLVTAALLALVFAGCSYMPFGGSGWTTLVDGASGMDNFNPVGDANWRAEDGAIVNVAKVSPMPKAGGKWNTYEITAKGSQLTVVLNGVQTVSVQNSQFAQGRLALQYGLGPKDAPGGPIKWRKVQIKPL